MKSRGICSNVVIGFSILPFVAFSGCYVQLGGCNQAKYERTISRQLAAVAGNTLDVATSSGSIKITGADGNDCSITALVVAHAPTEQEAQELAEQVDIRSDSDGDTLKIRADQPDLTNNRSISVNYTIAVPRRMSVLAISEYGSIDVVGMQGTVKGKTSSGSMHAEGIQGPLDLATSYGSITCKGIAGPTTLLQSSSGSITVAGLKGEAKARTSYGSITCRESSGGQLDLKSDSGSITLLNVSFENCLAVTDYGSVACEGFKGKAIKQRSSSGAVDLTDAQADAVDLHTSYGRVAARQITTGDLLANAGSGGIDVICSESCPASLKANAKTTYGSITFKAPPQFSGEVRLSTEYGSVHTALPITVTGGIDKKNVVGRIGEGTGTIHLETASGSIELK